MGEYSKFISEKRRSVETPKNLAENGKAVFGTFNKEFDAMDLVSLKKPTEAPDFLNKKKLTLWEATEINLKEGVLLVAASDMGIFGTVFHVFYDKRNKKVYSWQTNMPAKNVVIAPNLKGGEETKAEAKNARITYTNNFDQGKCRIEGYHEDKDNKIVYSFVLKRLSNPSIVSIPFGDNRPLYSQKDFFKAEGTLTINGETLTSDLETTAIVDDHRGYYPRKSHYDWVTTMGVNVHNKEKKWFAFNLTRNQSINQDDYNENLIWFENRTSLLPPVVFNKKTPSSKFKEKGKIEWEIKDEHGMVDIVFEIDAMNAMVVHALVINIDYYITFGTLKGYVLDENGEKYILDGMLGMGEDKSLLL